MRGCADARRARGETHRHRPVAGDLDAVHAAQAILEHDAGHEGRVDAGDVRRAHENRDREPAIQLWTTPKPKSADDEHERKGGGGRRAGSERAGQLTRRLHKRGGSARGVPRGWRGAAQAQVASTGLDPQGRTRA